MMDILDISGSVEEGESDLHNPCYLIFNILYIIQGVAYAMI